MEKIRIGFTMSRKWTDPTMCIFLGLFGGAVGNALFAVQALRYLGFLYGLVTVAAVWGLQVFLYDQWGKGPAPIEKFVKFKNQKLEEDYAGKRIPYSTLYEAYVKGQVEFKDDVLKVLEQADDFCNYKITPQMAKWLIMQLFPNDQNSSEKDLKATKKEIVEHYDRGNDWFASFLGPSMVYTSSVFYGLEQSLETAQANKMSLICEKLKLKKGDRHLDIGCGWGTLTRHAAKHFGCESVGVTLSQEGTKWCNEQNKKEGLTDKVKILTMDYREVPAEMKFDGISAIEMAEHVGLKNFQLFLNSVKSKLTDEGCFLMQVCGLRKGANWRDVAWGLFMSKYIFPGADASTPCDWYVSQLEKAGFEVQTAENITHHYEHTLHRWYLNFLKNKKDIGKKYPAELVRLWEFFLASSVLAGRQGTGKCYQFLCHKDDVSYDRCRFISKELVTKHPGLHDKTK